MDLSRFKQWIYRKKNKKYEWQISDYSRELKKAIDESIKQKLYESRSKSFLVQISPTNQPQKDGEAGVGQDQTTEPAGGKPDERLSGIIVDRSSIKNAKVNEEIALIHQKSNKVVARGFILSVDRQQVKIKFYEKFQPIAEEPKPEPEPVTTDDQAEPKSTLPNGIIDEPERETKPESPLVSTYIIRFDHRHILDKRQQIERSINKLKGLNRSMQIHKCLVGYYSDFTNKKHTRARVVSLDGLPSPRGKQQILAITQSMKNRISLIEGVAGSGKTLVAANIACSSARLRRHRVLLCSPVQATVDMLARMIDQAQGVSVVQLSPGVPLAQTTRRKSPNQPPQALKTNTIGYTNCLLDKLVDDHVYALGWAKFQQSEQPNRSSEEILRKQAKRLVHVCSPWLRRKVEREILLRADIVCCTTEQAGSLSTVGLKFGMLVIDDAQMASELDCLVPMMLKGIKQVTLLSDMRRDIRLSRSISPASDESSEGQSSWQTISSDEGGSEKVKRQASVEIKAITSNKNNSFKRQQKTISQNRSPPPAQMKLQRHPEEFDHLEPGGLFERFISMGLAAVAMKYQYRMHRALAAFPNRHFYMSRLGTDKVINDQLTRRIRNDLLINEESFSWLPKRECLTAIFDTLATSNSVNDTVRDIIGKLVVKENVSKSRIGVIVNNLSQTYSPSTSYGQSPYDVVDIGLIGEFTGREKDFIILACFEPETDINISSTTSESSDFLKNDTALNVALTRARLGLFIVADLKNLLEDESAQISKDDQLNLEGYSRSWRLLVEYYRKNKLVA